MLARIETKVWAGLAGFVTGSTALSSLALWALGAYAFHGSTAASAADATIGRVPWPVTLAVTGLLGALTGTAAAYKAPASNNAGNPTVPATAPEQLP